MTRPTTLAIVVFLAALLGSSIGHAEKPEKTKKDKKTKKVRISGYLQVFYKHRLDQDGDGTTEPGVFRVQRARIALEGQIVEHVSYDLEVDPRAPLVSGILRDAYISLDYIPHHKLRIGQQKTQFGYENTVSSTVLYTVNRAEMSDSLARGVTLRDIGLGLIGRWPVGGGFSLEDAITVVNGAGMNVQADDTARKNVFGRVGVRYKDKAAKVWARFGLSGAIGDQAEPDDPGPPPTPGFTFTFQRVGVDLEIDFPWAFIATEAAVGTTESLDPVPPGLDTGGESGGFYALVAGKTPWRVGPVVRYDMFDDFWRITAGAYWGLPADAVRVLVNYEILEDDAGRHDDKLYLWTQVRF